MEKYKTIGFIGQGWIGKNYADEFENRGFKVVRYSLEEPHVHNGDKIADCDIVFIAVPTPTTPNGFDDSIVRSLIKLVGQGKTAVIKSTILPGTTESIQAENEGVYVFHSPEFLTERTAAYDVANPGRNLIGIAIDNDDYRQKAQEVLDVLPSASIAKIMTAREAELFKYMRNCFFYTKVIFMNMAYDLADKNNCSWDLMREIMGIDPWIGNMHIDPVHKGGRGAGGHCYIKDFAAFSKMYEEMMPDDMAGQELLEKFQAKNKNLLVDSKKDLDLLVGVYGEDVLHNGK
jgi:nucleotide sugar dehydrogenase